MKAVRLRQPVQGKRLRLEAVTVASRRDQIDMIRAIEAHDLHPVIARTFPLERLADAFRQMQAGEHIGKLSIEI